MARAAAAPGETASPEILAGMVDDFVAQHPAAAVIEDGAVLFDLRAAKYSLSGAHGRCVLQLWSEERNLVRTVLSAERRASGLRLLTRRMGAAKPTALEFVPHREVRNPTARNAARKQYVRLLERVLQRAFPDFVADGLRAATDLEHSFGPAYVRGHLFKGTQAEAVIGVSEGESAAMVDGVLTLGLLWLDHCREQSVRRGGGSRHFGGLRVIVPAGAWRTTSERMAWLNPALAAFRLYALDERTEQLTELDPRDCGNVDSRLAHAFDATAAIERALPGVQRVLELLPVEARAGVELRARSAGEVGMMLHGLEFARVRNAATTHSFAPQEEITFGAGAHETLLNEATEALCRTVLARLFESRRAAVTRSGKAQNDPLFRMQPERWLESCIRIGIGEFLPALRGEFLYSQVPAIGSGERGMLDLLMIDRAGRLTIVEVKADEDMHLPLQGLDYWIRVRALNADRRSVGNRDTGSFERQGYFGGAEIAAREPKLLLVAPALRIHPSNEIVLRYFSPAVEWEMIAVGEHWREDLKIIFRKRAVE